MKALSAAYRVHKQKKSFTVDGSDLCGFWHIQDRGSRLNIGSSISIV